MAYTGHDLGMVKEGTGLDLIAGLTMAWRHLLICFVCFACTEVPAWAVEPMWKAGVAKVLITPQQPMWLSGYASRTRPADGKFQDLYAKALALEDTNRNVSLLVTADLVGISRELSHSIRTEITRRCSAFPEKTYFLPFRTPTQDRDRAT